MAKVITTTVRYKGQTYTVLFTQASGSMTIRMMDEEQRDVLPDGPIICPRDMPLEPGTPQMAEVHNLIAAILATVEASGGL